jgi:hypothetical protein
MNFDAPAPPDRAAVLSHTDGLDMKVSTRQKQGATRHKGVGAKGDNSAFPAPTWPSNPVFYQRSDERAREQVPVAAPRACQALGRLATLEGPADRRGVSASVRTLG